MKVLLLVSCLFSSWSAEAGGNEIRAKQVADARMGGETVEIRVFLREQFLKLYIGGKPAFCTDVSTGQKAGWTPLGSYTIISKSASHRSSTYGKYVAKSGKVIRGSIDTRKVAKPAGARFVGAPMPNFLRLTNGGIGIHGGDLPGYPASKGCIRVRDSASKILFNLTQVGDLVHILPGSGTGVCDRYDHQCERSRAR